MVVADPEQALTGREASAASAVASPALIEAIERAIDHAACRSMPRCASVHDVTPELARAAYAAMVEHLGLVEEARYRRGAFVTHQQRRLVSRWVEVDHGSE
jgi:hypothetical protein